MLRKNIMYGREGVMQGGAPAMVAYVIGVLPLTKKLKVEYPDVTQPWYTYDDDALGMFNKIGL